MSETTTDPRAAELREWLSMQYDDANHFPFIEDENCNITGYGHQDPTVFAAEINRYDQVTDPGDRAEDDIWTADSVAHRWAVLDCCPTEHDDRFWVEIAATNEHMAGVLPVGPVTETTPGAFPITTLWGQR